MSEDVLSLLAFEKAPVGIVMTQHRIIKACNRTFCELTGYKKPDLIGASFRKLYSSEREFEAIRDIGLETLARRRSYSDQRLLYRNDGTTVWCRFRAHTLTPENPLSQAVLSYARISKPDEGQKPLTARERDIISGLTRGLTSKEMAKELNLSIRTVEDVRWRLLKKYNVRNSSELLWHFINIES